MVTLEQTKQGVGEYIDSEFVSRVPGFKKVAVAVGAAAYVAQAEQKILDLKFSPCKKNKV